MAPHNAPRTSDDVQAGLQLFRRGRFGEAAAALQRRHDPPRSSLAKDPLAMATLADALQRTGRNAEAERIASRCLARESQPLASAHLHYVLGNVARERGDGRAALGHLQDAVTLGSADREFSCWAQLRLMALIGELNGWQAANARSELVNRTLTRHGDPRPFIALHLWLVEADTIRGELDKAMRHLDTASSLLAQLDNAWLAGYLAVNSSVLHYHRANIAEARTWAAAALMHAGESGHRSTLRSAHTNLGYFDFSTCQFDSAEAHFQTALGCCEDGSPSQVAIMVNIAEARLHRGDIAGCHEVLDMLEALGDASDGARRRHYRAWFLQAKIRLQTTLGKRKEALDTAKTLTSLLEVPSHARLSVESRLVAAEAQVEDEAASALVALAPVMVEGLRLPPDLFAEAELLIGRSLRGAGHHDLGSVHVARAARTFKTIGHRLGYERATASRDASPHSRDNARGGVMTIDRVRALIDLRTRPELFGQEAVALLEYAGCVSSAAVVVTDRPHEDAALRLTDTDRRGARPPVVLPIGQDTRGFHSLVFVAKPEVDAIIDALNCERLLRYMLMSPETTSARDGEVVWATAEHSTTRDGAVFASEAMLGVLRIVERIAPTDISVIITGETGTGKEVVARAIHEHSNRASMPFLTFNCATIPKELVESQLFGHRKGSFSGAIDNYTGIVRAAAGGTLFLDEIADLALETQAKLLRFLELGEVHPLGESRPVKVDVRLVFATNRDLDEAVQQKRFRQDLYYRLHVLPLALPALRDRREEIPVLANLFAGRCAREMSRDVIRFSTEAMETLILYSWPGNIRQLANEVKRLTALLPSGACVAADDLAPSIRNSPRLEGASTQAGTQLAVRIDQSMASAVDTLEAAMIAHALRVSHGRVSDAAQRLGISRKGLYLKRLRLGLIDENENQPGS